ncbi:patatin-like phospholipase family protein [Halomonas sp. McH1-25]|uniref:patatin-like phospholipase family protein n=1 Tax=unclassified Halomonas TaxID=2609666 RepID=UPI001EF661F9|nr:MULTISPECIES: patatin-like phospholipase family protein [unclassified Halomonas]MCG7600157.1 patatin-like phospholipase family protein [Halomonas sp. McH1-25]MCP1341406.1 patatin-like phospholipase family protein [Halomonas sp. FL8]MCP1359649.1 patatin-like phospholipase family protein [Halomonas sp. BBD45]
MPQTKAIDLALQGGGSHGAFTWGVLDYLLESSLVEIEAISGTSAGAMNAVAMADGLMRDGKAGARRSLHAFWQGVSRAAMLSPIRRTPLDIWMGDWSLDHSPGYLAFDLLSRVVSPYQYNPLDINPLRDILDAQIDFERVHACRQLQLYVCATNVRTGKQRVFRNAEVTRDALLASACLPLIYQSIEIDGEHYWDGGYMGNPTLFPLLEECDARDIVIIQTNPICRDQVPSTAAEILNRLNEITFNASLIKEIRTVAMLKRLIEDHDLDIGRYRDALFHRIAEHAFEHLPASSKFNGEWSFLRELHDRGRHAAQEWLEANYDALGERSTLDIDEVYM